MLVGTPVPLLDPTSLLSIPPERPHLTSWSLASSPPIQSPGVARRSPLKSKSGPVPSLPATFPGSPLRSGERPEPRCSPKSSPVVIRLSPLGLRSANLRQKSGVSAASQSPQARAALASAQLSGKREGQPRTRPRASLSALPLQLIYGKHLNWEPTQSCKPRLTPASTGGSSALGVELFLQ